MEQSWRSFQTHNYRMEPNIPDAHYKFSVGEKVKVGNLPNCEVDQVLMDGRLLVISMDDRDVFNSPPKWDHHRRVPEHRWWVDVQPMDLMGDTHFSRERIRCQILSNDLHSLIFTAYHLGLRNNPDYQRDYVWTLENKQKLIDSIFNKVNIGQFVFISSDDVESLEVVDGKQRLNAIMEYTQGCFEYRGKTFFQLSKDDQRDFFDIHITYLMIEERYVKRSEILWLFLSINTGGVPQTEEHVAKAQRLYQEALKAEGKS
jgi:hypothetical protein